MKASKHDDNKIDRRAGLLKGTNNVEWRRITGVTVLPFVLVCGRSEKNNKNRESNAEKMTTPEESFSSSPRIDRTRRDVVVRAWLGRERFGRYAGRLNFVGGGVEPSERGSKAGVMAAAEREFREEARCAVQPRSRFWRSVAHVFQAEKDDGTATAIFMLHAQMPTWAQWKTALALDGERVYGPYREMRYLTAVEWRVAVTVGGHNVHNAGVFFGNVVCRNSGGRTSVDDFSAYVQKYGAALAKQTAVAATTTRLPPKLDFRCDTEHVRVVKVPTKRPPPKEKRNRRNGEGGAAEAGVVTYFSRRWLPHKTI